MLLTGIVKAWKNIFENKSSAVSGIITTSIAMILLGCVVLVYLNLIGLTQALFQQANYSIFVASDADEIVRSTVISELNQVPDLKNIRIINSDEARTELIESFGDTGSVLNKIELPTFPDVIEFSLDRASLLTDEEIERIKSIPGVDNIVSGKETKDQIETFFTISEFVGIFLITLLIICIVLMIHNSIQLAVRARIEEIEILRILGATRLFIQIPFVVEGVLIAFFGYLFSLFAIYFLYTFVLAGITFNEATYGISAIARFFSAKQLLLILTSTMALGFFSSLVSTSKVLRELKV
jgi:cell division transport system permease protein